MPEPTDSLYDLDPGTVVEMVDSKLFTCAGPAGHITRPVGWLCHYVGGSRAGHRVTSTINGRVYFANVRDTEIRAVNDPDQVCGCVPPHPAGEFPYVTTAGRTGRTAATEVGAAEASLIDCGGCLAEHYQLPPGTPHTCQPAPPRSRAEAARQAHRERLAASTPAADQLVRRLMTFGRGRCNWLLVDVWATEHRAPTTDDLCPQPATRRVEVILPGDEIGGGEFAQRTILTSLCHGHAVAVTTTLAKCGAGEHREIVDQPAEPAPGWRPVYSEHGPRTVLYWRRQVRQDPATYLVVVEDADIPGRWLWSVTAGTAIVEQGASPSQYQAMQAADNA